MVHRPTTSTASVAEPAATVATSERRVVVGEYGSEGCLGCAADEGIDHDGRITAGLRPRHDHRRGARRHRSHRTQRGGDGRVERPRRRDRPGAGLAGRCGHPDRPRHREGRAGRRCDHGPRPAIPTSASPRSSWDRWPRVRAGADEILGRIDDIDILVDNAGVMACPQGVTADGFETQFGTNHLGHFLFTCLLAPALVSGGPARVVVLSFTGPLPIAGALRRPRIRARSLRQVDCLRPVQDGQRALRRGARPSPRRPGRPRLRRPPGGDHDRPGASPPAGRHRRDAESGAGRCHAHEDGRSRRCDVGVRGDRAGARRTGRPLSGGLPCRRGRRREHDRRCPFLRRRSRLRRGACGRCRRSWWASTFDLGASDGVGPADPRGSSPSWRRSPSTGSATPRPSAPRGACGTKRHGTVEAWPLPTTLLAGPGGSVGVAGLLRLAKAVPGRRDDVVAIVNGLFGDTLEDRSSRWATPMTLRLGETVLPLDRTRAARRCSPRRRPSPRGSASWCTA